ncbi:MAG: glycosyltransferase family 2 protein, partial [Methanobacteriaceae archaeon]
NWNGWGDTVECLESLYRVAYPCLDVVVVDNASEDESLARIREYCKGDLVVESPFFTYNPHNKPITITELTEEQTMTSQKRGPVSNPLYDHPAASNELTIIKNHKNHGFAVGNNIAINYALENLNQEYILLLNNDTVVDPYFLDNLVDVAENDEKIGLLGPLIYYYDVDGRRDVVANLGGRVDLSHYPGYYDLVEVNRREDFSGPLIECEWISGAALLMKTKEIPIHTLNPELFFGCEDIDLAIKLKKQGYKSVVVLNSYIWHKEAVSRKKRSSDSINRVLMEIKSNLTFLKAHNHHFYRYMPLYVLQIVKIYMKIILKG